MLNFDEMIKCGQKYAFEKKQMNVAKYKAFIEYLKKVINLTFEGNEKQIASYLKETNDQTFLLDWCVGGSHYDGFHICRLTDEMVVVNSLRAHATYYDPILKLESDINEDDLLIFFNKEYNNFMYLFTPKYCLEDYDNESVDKSDSVVCRIAKNFNNVCFNYFETYFSSLGINDSFDFDDSKFSLSFTDEQRKKLDKEVYECYNSYCEKVAELVEKFDESVKDLK